MNNSSSSQVPSGANDSTLVITRGVHKSFDHEKNQVTVLHDINFELPKGQIVTIVGPSGAGKSTLLYIIGGLDTPSSGDVFFKGQNLAQLSPAELARFRNRHVGFVFQFHHLLPEFSALENVMMPGLIATGKHLTEKAKSLLHEVGLSHRTSHRPGELSGGEQQRVALARALLMDPELVQADEPTGNLDSQTSERVHELVFELNQKLGTTFLIVTHNRDLADRSPRVVSMIDGKISEDRRASQFPAAQRG